MNRDLLNIERSVYNIFMMLGDIGGLYGLFVSFASIVLGYINFQKLENQLAARLFKQSKKEHLLPEKQWALREYL